MLYGEAPCWRRVLGTYGGRSNLSSVIYRTPVGSRVCIHYLKNLSILHATGWVLRTNPGIRLIYSSGSHFVSILVSGFSRTCLLVVLDRLKYPKCINILR